MTELLVSVVVILALVALAGWLLLRGGTTEPVAALDSPEAPAPVVPIVKRAEGPKPDPTYIKVRFTSAKGRKLAELHMHPKARRPQLTHRTREGLSVFLCSHQEPDGLWVYRRTGVERE